MTKFILGIHGLSNKPEKQILKQWWEISIREGLNHNCNLTEPKFTFIMVYWADLLYKYQAHHDKNFYFDDAYNEEPYYPAHPADLRKRQVHWFDQARSRFIHFVSSGVSALRSHVKRDWLTEYVIRSKYRDLHFYWSEEQQIKRRDGQMALAGEVLRADLTGELVDHAVAEHQLLLIAHSMGSIIAYDTLRDIGRTKPPPLEVDYLVTIGSPLSFPETKARIQKDPRRYHEVRTPTIVKKRWVNLSDSLDRVAVDTHLRDDYGPNARGVQVEDQLVFNDYRSPITDSKNPHKSYGYLRCPEMSRTIAEFLAE